LTHSETYTELNSGNGRKVSFLSEKYYSVFLGMGSGSPEYQKHVARILIPKQRKNNRGSRRSAIYQEFHFELPSRNR
jgi:hypothetical protein